MECMGLGEMGDGTLENLCSTHPLSTAAVSGSHTERFLNSRRSVTGKHASNMQSFAFSYHLIWVFAANSPKDSEDKALLCKDLWKCQESKCHTSIVSTLGWLNFTQGVPYSMAVCWKLRGLK